ncbi:MAG TPA: hypothetical protein VHG53_00015 [Candidatus Limnocylindria bacterium]|nr:hypothetical protein [Candidatus Limnocylindria bacterium]
MIASQAVRLASPSAARRPSPSHATRAPRGRARTSSAASRLPGRARPTGSAVPASSWDLRVFALAFATIVFAFALALLYVSETTALSAASYDVQKLQAARDELRRQNSLIDVQGARLDSPARITVAATRLGMVHISYVPVISAEPLAAKR